MNAQKKITSENDLIELLEADYIRREVRIHMQSTARMRNAQNGITQAPRIQREPTGAVIRPSRNTQPVQATQAIVETNTAERIWFETKAMTGGSRNILDLSKLGSICEGAATGSKTQYSFLLK